MNDHADDLAAKKASVRASWKRVNAPTDYKPSGYRRLIDPRGGRAK